MCRSTIASRAQRGVTGPKRQRGARHLLDCGVSSREADGRPLSVGSQGHLSRARDWKITENRHDRSRLQLSMEGEISSLEQLAR